MPPRTIPPFRADHVGSLLRPPALLDAREKFRKGEIDRATLTALEDEVAKLRLVVEVAEEVWGT